MDHTLDDAIRVHESLGLTRGLLVQSFQHGYTYEYMLHVLCREPKRFRAVAIPAPDITDAELEILDNAGVIGIRFAPRSTRNIDTTLVDRVHQLGWSTHVLVHGADEVEAWREQILSLPGRFVLEHTGYPPVDKGFDSFEYRFLLECLDTGRCWVKLSPRFSVEKTVPFSDTLPIIRSLIQRAPARMLWGLDWPHQSHPEPKPADDDLLDLLLEWAPEENIRNRILIANPAELFHFK